MKLIKVRVDESSISRKIKLSNTERIVYLDFGKLFFEKKFLIHSIALLIKAFKWKISSRANLLELINWKFNKKEKIKTKQQN